MFDFVRNHSRLMFGVMVLLIFPAFAFFGIQGYSRFTDPGNETVAKVAGHSISRGEWDNAHARSIDRMRRQMPGVDVKLFETPQLRRESLEQMLRERVLQTAADEYHLYPDDRRLGHLFDSDPSLQALRGPDGKINESVLAAQGLTGRQFDAQLRQQFGMQQVLAGIGQSAFAPAALANNALDAMLQRREVQLQRFDAAAYRAKINASDADVEAFYKAHEADFRAPEQADIEYVVLSIDTLAKTVVVSEQEARKFYDDNAARYTAPEERRASHILVKAEPDKPAAERQAAKARAEALLQQVKKNPASFAEVAKKNSQDPGSAAQGGDLDWFGRGMMAKPFEDEAFRLKAGDISDVIETDFGFHIVTVTGARGGEKKPFDAVRGEIEAELRKSKARTDYAKLADQFSDAVYQQPSLQAAIDKFKLEKQTATVQRTPAPGASGPLASPKLLEAVFASESVRDKRSTDAVEIGPSQMAAARIVNHRPARTLPLADVKERVKERVVGEQAAKLAKQDGEKRLEALRKNPAEALPETLTVSRRTPQNLPPPLLEAVLRADASKLPAPLGVDLGDEGYVVGRVTQVLPREALPGGDAALAQQVGQAWGNAEAGIYLAQLKKRYKAEVKEEAVAAAAASAPSN
jgi:peptidyl-prolyl cis-trans isomerase D